jgi:hypothetical protein
LLLECLGSQSSHIFQSFFSLSLSLLLFLHFFFVVHVSGLVLSEEK